MFALVLLVVIATSLWVLFDADAIGVKKGVIKGVGDMGKWGWFFSCLGLWIFAFPYYLAKRKEYKKAILEPRASSPTPTSAEMFVRNAVAESRHGSVAAAVSKFKDYLCRALSNSIAVC
jgi:hypothetical protein